MDDPFSKEEKDSSEKPSGSHRNAQVLTTGKESAPQQVGESSGGDAPPPTKRLKTDASASLPTVSRSSSSQQQQKTPDIATEPGDAFADRSLEEVEDRAVPNVAHATSSGSIESDLSSASAATRDRHETLSPIPTFFAQEVPPAPPSTPASQSSLFSWDGSATPLPIRAAVLNARELEEQHLMPEGAATPAPTKSPSAASSDTSKPAALPEDFSEWAVGDRYHMIRLLGRGSYGEVAQALDLFAGRPDAYVAIKRIQSPFDVEVDAVRLYREIHILRRMRGHSCIIQLLDVVQPPTDDLDDFHDLYLVFEYVDTDLYKLIMSPQYLTTEHIQTFLYQMLVACKYIHSLSVIHRDLKPANVLINEDCSLKICDFGLARIVNTYTMSAPTTSEKKEKATTSEASMPEVPKLGLTRQLTKHVVTRWYRAPELILIQPYTSAVDIWSLGCILAELLSMQEGNVSGGYQNRKPLFPGGTCYPLSGEGAEMKKDERLDQLSVIFHVIGSPSPQDVAAIGKARVYVDSLGKIEGKPLQQLFPAAAPAALDLLKNMLQFNPARRVTAEEALEHEFFSDIRRKELEISADGPLQGPDFIESDSVDLKLLKRIIYEEVLWYRDHGSAAQAAAKVDQSESPT